MQQVIVVPSSTAHRARMRLAQAEAIIEGFTDTYNRVVGLFTRVPAATDGAARTIRRAWLRASA